MTTNRIENSKEHNSIVEGNCQVIYGQGTWNLKTHILLYIGKRVFYDQYGEAMYCKIPNIDVFPDPFISIRRT